MNNLAVISEENINPAAIPKPVDDVQGDNRWWTQHNIFLHDSMLKEAEIIWIGDSIIANMALSQYWRDFIEPLHPLNFGIGGDQTQNVLWRIQQKELTHSKAKVIVLHVGTNNFGHTAEQIAGGLKEIIIAITKEKPSALLLVTTLLPRGLNPNPLRVRNAAVNVLLEDIVIELSKTNANVELIKIDQGFILPSGLISRKDFFDFLHLTNEGYKKAFENVHERAKSKLMDFCC
uniref:SGNH hydrolase-type esterase domain-containing protein n=1 Tax=Timema tahoe TaxID=61484 RepID=A0A7R9IQJ3_9NEOP|nr:unnamed protein product [Timema tahoe]